MVRTGLIFFLALALGACTTSTREAQAPPPAPVAPISYASTQYLLEADQLERLLAHRNPIVLIDLRKPAEYAQGHLPGAHNVWRPQIQDTHGYPYGGMRLSLPQAEAFLGSLGITPQHKIVIYDAKGGVDAARLWWMLCQYGHHNVALLHGGLPAWQAQGYPISQEAPATPTPAQYHFCGQPVPSLLATRETVLAAIQDTTILLLDTRSTDEYTGAVQKDGAFKPGRIASSIHLDYYDNLDTSVEGQLRFKSYQDLKAMYQQVGITADQPVIAYCHSGVRSAHTTFVLTQLLGYPLVANYDGSWTEWSYFNELPIENDATPVAQ